MERRRLLIGYTFAGWLLHSVIAGSYSKRFKSSKSLSFRLTHMLEIFGTMSAVIYLFKRRHGLQKSNQMVQEVLTVLAVLDGLSFALVKPLRKRFDWLHVTLAYAAVSTAIKIVARTP